MASDRYWDPTRLDALDDETDEVQDFLATDDGLVAMFGDRPDGDDRIIGGESE